MAVTRAAAWGERTTATFNADTDGLAGIQQLAGDATLLYYLTEESKEGRNAFIEKRPPDFSKFQRFP